MAVPVFVFRWAFIAQSRMQELTVAAIRLCLQRGFKLMKRLEKSFEWISFLVVRIIRSVSALPLGGGRSLPIVGLLEAPSSLSPLVHGDKYKSSPRQGSRAPQAASVFPPGGRGKILNEPRRGGRIAFDGVKRSEKPRNLW